MRCRWSASRPMPISVFATWCSMPPDRTRNGFCTSMASRSCRACAPHRADAMKTPTRLTLCVVPGIPLLLPGDDLGAIIITALTKAGLVPGNGDIVVVPQKAVSKAQGRYVDLAAIKPSWHAREVAVEVNKDPRLVEVILSES